MFHAAAEVELYLQCRRKVVQRTEIKIKTPFEIPREKCWSHIRETDCQN